MNSRMLNFKIWLENNQDIEVTIDYTSFLNKLQDIYENSVQSIQDRIEELSNFDREKFLSDLKSQSIDYENIDLLINALKTKNYTEVRRLRKNYFDWIKKNDKYEKNFKLYRMIGDYLESLEPESFDFVSHKQHYDNTVIKSKEECENLKTLIKNIILDLPDFSSNVKIIPDVVIDESNHEIIEIPNSFTVELGNKENFNSQFSLYKHNDQIEIDDILEGGDTDFFTNNQEQNDYFMLIQKLKSEPNKIITVYTARPTKDREFYSSTKTLPKNIFLTTDFEDAYGRISDYGQPRDIWKVLINTKYLMKTLDEQKIKHYQVVADNATVDKIEPYYLYQS